MCSTAWSWRWWREPSRYCEPGEPPEHTAIRAVRRENGCMQISRRKRLIRKRKLVAYSGRGEIYSWLRAHHGQIVALRVGEERPWSEVLADMREDLAGGEGAPAVSLNNVAISGSGCAATLRPSLPGSGFCSRPGFRRTGDRRLSRQSCRRAPRRRDHWCPMCPPFPLRPCRRLRPAAGKDA